MDKMNISQYFEGGISEVFNPNIVYEGLYGFNTDVLSFVGKKENGKNLFDEYLENNFLKYIRNVFGKLNFTNNPRLFVISDVDGNYGRSLKISAKFFLTELCYNLVGDAPTLPEDDSKIRDVLLEYLRNYRKNITKILNGESNDEVNRINNILKNNYLRNEEHRKIVLGNRYYPMQYGKFLELIKENIGTFLVGLRYIIPYLDKNINLDELESTLDLEKFYLAMVKQMIEVSHIALDSVNKIHNSFVFVEKYMMAVKELRAKGKYDLKVKTCLMDGSVITYSVDDAIREYTEIKIAHPEFAVYTFDNDGKDYRNLDTAREFATSVEEYIESKKLEASWEFIRNGKKEDVIQVPEVVERLKKANNKNKKVSREERSQAVIDRMDFLNHTNYLYKMTGKDNFEGYIGYIYENGIVLFEKFYKKQGSLEPTSSNATYVMTFNNFVQMSKLTKTDIMEYIKQGGTDVRRIYHTSTWCERVLQVIDGKTYDEKAMEKIDRLINEGQLSKIKK